MATLHGDAKEAFVDFWNRAFAIGVLKSCIDGGFWIVADRNLAKMWFCPMFLHLFVISVLFDFHSEKY